MFYLVKSAKITSFSTTLSVAIFFKLLSCQLAMASLSESIRVDSALESALALLNQNKPQEAVTKLTDAAQNSTSIHVANIHIAIAEIQCYLKQHLEAIKSACQALRGATYPRDLAELYLGYIIGRDPLKAQSARGFLESVKNSSYPHIRVFAKFLLRCNPRHLSYSDALAKASYHTNKAHTYTNHSQWEKKEAHVRIAELCMSSDCINPERANHPTSEFLTLWNLYVITYFLQNDSAKAFDHVQTRATILLARLYQSEFRHIHKSEQCLKDVLNVLTEADLLYYVVLHQLVLFYQSLSPHQIPPL